MGNLDHGAAAINLMAVLQSIDYNKSERFSNIAHQIFAKLLSNFLECEMLKVLKMLKMLKVLKENTGQKTHLM